MRVLATVLRDRLATVFRGLGRIIHVPIAVGFAVWAVTVMWKCIASQKEFGFATVAALLCLFWVLLGVFVLDTDGMDVIDTVVDWFQPEPSERLTKKS